MGVIFKKPPWRKKTPKETETWKKERGGEVVLGEVNGKDSTCREQKGLSVLMTISSCV